MTLVLKIDGVTYDMYSAALHNAIKRLQAELDEVQKQESNGMGCTIDQMLSKEVAVKWGLDEHGHKRNVQHIFMRCCQSISDLEAELDTAKEENKRLRKSLDIITQDNKDGWPKMIARIEETKQLREFARHVIRQECWSISELDGGDIQGLAEKLELIVPCQATAEDVDDDCDYEVGDRIFKFSKALKGN